MQTDNFKTSVVFRKWQGAIIALFPYVPYNARLYSYDTCNSYMSVGQHGSADYGHIIEASAPANEVESKELKNELEGLGYNLEVISKRNTWKAIQEWRKAKVNLQELV